MIRTLTKSVVACFALSVLPPVIHLANADKLSDFQEAVKNKGYDSIPY